MNQSLEPFKDYQHFGLTGLSNLGNTCFLNTTLQCLSHTYEFHQLLKDETFQTRIPDGLLKEFNDLRQLMWHKNCVITPGGFVKAVQETAKKKNRPMFSGTDQNDVSEFIHFLFESFHENVSRRVKMNIHGTPCTDKDYLAKKCFEMIKTMYEKEYSELLDLFFGIHVSQIKGMNDKLIRATPEPFFTLTLPIPTKTPMIPGTKHAKKITLYDCFDLYTDHEIMSGSNAWYNEDTDQKETVQKGVVFWSLPDILVVELKRYFYKETPRGIHMMKNNIPVDFKHDEILNLSKYTIGYQPSKYRYTLYGVCNHMGNMNGGHYTAYVKNANGKWYHYNDRSVSEIKNPSNIVTAKAYALWFRRLKA